MSQTTYGAMPVAIAGMISDSAPGRRIDSYVQGEASLAMGFGLMAVQGTAGGATGAVDKAIIPVDANSVPVGPVVHSQDYADRELNTVGVLPTSLLSVLRRGRCWVQCETTPTAGAAVLWRHTANGGNTTIGIFRHGADTGALAIKGARFTGRNATGLAELEIDMLTATTIA